MFDWLSNEQTPDDTGLATSDGVADDHATVPCAFCGEPCLDPGAGGVGITMDGKPACYTCSLT